jgi:hypothetical protein
MAIDDINFTAGDNTFILEISGTPSLNPPNDILVTAGIPNGLVAEFAAGPLNPPTDMVTDKWLIKEIKLPDCFAY